MFPVLGAPGLGQSVAALLCRLPGINSLLVISAPPGSFGHVFKRNERPKNKTKQQQQQQTNKKQQRAFVLDFLRLKVVRVLYREPACFS